MNRYRILGNGPIYGSIKCQGSKNAVLPILAASILNGGKTKLHNCPDLKDVNTMITILRELGCKIEKNGDMIEVDTSNLESYEITEKLMRQMRSSIILMGPMLSRNKKIVMSYPGGCDLGPRPIDMHINGLKKFGATINESHGYISCSVENLKGSDIYLDFPSVGATENLMCMAIFAQGDTYIRNAAREPEIIDLQNFLNNMGAKIKGAGTNLIKIVGVKELHDVEYDIMPDRIVAGTYLAAAVATRGEIEIQDIITSHLDSFLGKFKEMGCEIHEFSDRIRLVSPKTVLPVQMIRTAPYPGFPTDMQQQFMSVLSVGKGTSMIVETIFSNRYRNVNELMRMGANIKVDGRVAVISGVDELYGSTVTSSDLRGGAALIIAGLIANGETIVEDEDHIVRGYQNIAGDLKKLGANIEKI